MRHNMTQVGHIGNFLFNKYQYYRNIKIIQFDQLNTNFKSTHAI